MQLISGNLADVAFCSWRQCRINGAGSSVSSLLELLVSKFSAAKMSVADIRVDETMVQFLTPFEVLSIYARPVKTHKYGIKLFKLSDPDGRLTMALFNVYQTLQKKAWLPRCRWHCAKYLQADDTASTDNYYTSVPLNNKLIESKISHLVGTQRANQKYLAPDEKSAFPCFSEVGGRSQMKDHLYGSIQYRL